MVLFFKVLKPAFADCRVSSGINLHHQLPILNDIRSDISKVILKASVTQMHILVNLSLVPTKLHCSYKN